MRPRKLRRTFFATTILSAGLLLYSQSQLQVGFTIVRAQAGGTVPVGTALFSYTNSAGVLVSEAGVGGTSPISSGRIFVDEAGTLTGIALANPSEASASVTLILRDSAGSEVARKPLSLSPHEHLPRYVGQLFGGLPENFTGSLTFESSQKLGAITLRESRNVQGEVLYTTLPVVDLASSPGNQALVFPQIAAGSGYSTQLVLINTSAYALAGSIRFTSSAGSALSLRLNGTIAAEFTYRIEANGTYRADVDNPFGLAVGYAVVKPDGGTTSPVGTAIFQYKRDGVIVTEAGVAAAPGTTAARIYVDNVGTYTGVALANTADQTAEVHFTLLDRYGAVDSNTTWSLPALGHVAIFAHELFRDLPVNFTGQMEITSATPLVPITLKLTDNARGDQIMTTLPVADLLRPPNATELVFPHIAMGDGFSTRLIFINPSTTVGAAGILSFYSSNGSPMLVPLGGNTGSEFSYAVPVRGGRQYLPGNEAGAASVVVLDPDTHAPSREVVVNEGQSVQMNLLVQDTSGHWRDDFDFQCLSKDTAVASVDSGGRVQGKKAGFSSLTISTGGAVTTATATVVSVDSGPPGYRVTGLAQDLGRKLYMANSSDHTILLSPSVKQSPASYAGVSRSAGLKNDLRLQSWFNRPSFVALNQSEGSLYVGDTGNHVIRRIRPGPNGKAETLAGTGQAGSRDGQTRDALFNGPQGVALDGRGNLWVADTGNHTIRRISLVRGTAETIAGKPGVAGNADGKGDAARFNSPAGIAVATETMAEQLAREITGAPPPPVSVVVADTGNGLLRRVKETGEVEVVGSQAVSATAGRVEAARSAQRRRSPVTFDSPLGVAVDPTGNIHVTEPNAGRVRTLLKNGSVVSTSQEGTFTSPAGVVAFESGRIVVADSTSVVREIRYGEPQITSVAPSRVSITGGEQVLVTGSNFAPESIVVISGTLISQVEVQDTNTIRFTTLALPSGLATLSIQNRGGLAQTSILVEPVPLGALPTGYITTVAGGSTFAGDGGAAKAAGLFYPARVALDDAGNTYIADTYNCRVRKVSAASAIITTITGSGFYNYSGDDGPAILASVGYPFGLALDAANNLFIADSYNHRIRKIDAKTGVITTVAGNGTPGLAGDGGPARSANLLMPYAVAVNGVGDLFIADTGSNRVRKVAASTGILTSVAGDGRTGFAGDNGFATGAALSGPSGIALDASGNLFIADTGNNRIRRVDNATGVITTVAGNGIQGSSGDYGLAVAASLGSPYAVFVDPGGSLLIADTMGCRIRKVDPATGIITPVIGSGMPGYGGDGGDPLDARLMAPLDLLVDGSGNVLVADTFNHRIRRVDASQNTITTVAGDGTQGMSGDNGPASAGQLMGPYGVNIDRSGSVYIADTFNHRIRRVDGATGIITTVAGSGAAEYSGDNGPAIAAGIAMPEAAIGDLTGHLYIADTGNHRVRRVDTVTGTITTVAGNGNKGFSGDNGPANSAQLCDPRGLALDLSGNLLIADTENNRVRKVDLASGTISTVAGNGTPGFSGDGGPAVNAALSAPAGLAVDTSGDLYIADVLNQRIRRVAASSGVITTYAGSGAAGFFGDGGPATAARLWDPRGVAVDSAGNLYIGDTVNARIRMVSASTRTITTIAGSYVFGRLADGGPATDAFLAIPAGLAFDSSGNLFIADTGNHRIRAIRGPLR